MKVAFLFPSLALLLLSSFSSNGLQIPPLEDRIHNQTIRLYSKQTGNSYYGPDIETQTDVRESLLAFAFESNEGRGMVVNALIELLTDVATKQGHSTAWYVGADLLGELRATEAIDILVAYLDYSNGTTGLSLGHIPSARALVQIGEPAVPKLIQALYHGESLLLESNEFLREGAVRALGNIGGAEARQALEEALLIETDKTVIFSIERQLKAMSRESAND